jgi:hypothetical protein
MKWRKRKKQVAKSREEQPQTAGQHGANGSGPASGAEEIKYEPAPVLFITRTLLDRTAALLASFAERRSAEGVVYWFGLEFGAAAIVTTIVVPDADTRWGCVRTSPEVNAEALSVIVGTPLVLLGQAHSHPAYGVRHSPVDDRETFARFEGAVSVVVPFFGRRGINLRRCGVHRHSGGKFCVVSPSQVDRHIRVLPGEADLRRGDTKMEYEGEHVKTDDYLGDQLKGDRLQ